MKRMKKRQDEKRREGSITREGTEKRVNTQ
jgi:hypothetical protein